jgi:SNF2 family DNA or RNA helicase
MEPLYDAMMRWKPEALIFDEGHRLANPKAKRSKLADKLANKTTPRPLVYILTGTPVMNDMMDIFQPFKIMDGGQTFGDNFFAFRAKYFRDKNAGMNKHNYFPNWVPLPSAAADLSEKMKAKSMCVRKEDCLDLPPVVETILPVEMDAEQARIYKSMLKDYVAFLEQNGQNHAVMAQMAMTKGLRLMQIASGFVKTDEGLELPATKEWTPKQNALHDLLEGLAGRKVIIWCVFRYNYKQVRDVLTTLGRKYLELNGEMGSKKNRENAALFESSDEHSCIIAHPESSGEGINLVSASEMISYSRDFSWRRWEQCVARNYRGGSEIHDKITRYVLVAKGSIEERITEMLLRKEEVSNEVLRQITFQMGQV